MTFVHYRSLTPGAKKALKKAESTGYYKGRKYVVECLSGRRYIAVRDGSGRAMQWVLVVASDGSTIKEVRA